MVEKFQNEKWSVQLDAACRGKVFRNGELVKNARAIEIKCEVGKIPQVVVTLNASAVAAELDGAGSRLGIGPSVAELVITDETVARLRATLVRLHERAGLRGQARQRTRRVRHLQGPGRDRTVSFDPSRLPCPVCHRQQPPAPQHEVNTFSCLCCGYPYPFRPETVPAGTVALLTGGRLRVRAALFERDVIARVTKVRSMLEPAPGTKIVVELEVEPSREAIEVTVHE